MKLRDVRLCLLLLLAALAAGLVLHSCPRQLPAEQCSPVYQLYDGVEGIEASYIRNFPVNDTLSVPVTTLKATTDSAWQLLRKDFHLLPIPEEHRKKLDAGEDVVSVKLCSKIDPRKPRDSVNITQNHVLAYSHLHHTVSIFYTHNEPEQDAILFYNLKL